MNDQELRDLATEIAGHIAEALGSDAGAHEQIAKLIANGFRIWVPDNDERESVNRLFVAARGVAFQGAIDNDQFICTAERGQSLRAALLDYDNLMKERDRGER